MSLEVFNKEIAYSGDKVRDHDVDGSFIEGTLHWSPERNQWLIIWVDGETTLVLNPLQLHKIKDNEQE